MESEFQYDVFLSHNSKDKAVVRPLAERLRKDGLKVWFDAWEIKTGDSIPARIEAGLGHSRVLVLCLSPNAFGSDWAQLEAGSRARLQPERLPCTSPGQASDGERRPESVGGMGTRSEGAQVVSSAASAGCTFLSLETRAALCLSWADLSLALHAAQSSRLQRAEGK